MSKNKTIAIVMIVIAGLLSLYPVVGTLYNNKRLDSLSHEYKDKISVKPWVDTNNEALQQAEEYNQWLKKNPFQPPPIGHDREHKDYAKYAQMLREPNDTLGIITIPDIDINLPIYHGTSGDTLYKGAGHLYGTALPVGGEGMTSVITAHSGMVDASMFDNLSQLKEGQYAHIQVRDRKLTYKMVSSKTVPPDATDAIPFDSRDLLVLITCTPYGINTSRLVVTLERVQNVSDNHGGVTNSIATWQWWMTALVAVWVILIVVFIVLLRRDLSRGNAQENAAPRVRR